MSLVTAFVSSLTNQYLYLTSDSYGRHAGQSENQSGDAEVGLLFASVKAGALSVFHLTTC
jgi:hypothetical protein